MSSFESSRSRSSRARSALNPADSTNRLLTAVYYLVVGSSARSDPPGEVSSGGSPYGLPFVSSFDGDLWPSSLVCDVSSAQARRALKRTKPGAALVAQAGAHTGRAESPIANRADGI